MTFDPARQLVMAKFKTVLGHDLPVGTRLAVVETPSAPGEVDEAMARRLWNGGLAVYIEDLRPTPVETVDQAQEREAVEALAATEEGEDLAAVPDDLTVWQHDDEALGRKRGDKVTNGDLRAIADREEVETESDDNKADLQRKIVAARAARAESGAS